MIAGGEMMQVNQKMGMGIGLEEAADQVARESAHMLQSEQQQQLFNQMLQNMSQANGQRGEGMMPPTQMAYLKGYGGVYDPVIFGMATRMPEQVSGVQDFNAIVQQYDPELYQISNDMKMQIQSMAPYAQRALKNESSIYDPPTGRGYYENLLHIMNQRTRERDVYAFV